MPEKIRQTRSAAAAANKDKATSEPKRPNNSASNDNSDNGSGSRKKAKTTQEQITDEPEVDEATEDKKDEEDDEPEEVDESEGDDEPVEDLRSNMYPHFRPECQVFSEMSRSGTRNGRLPNNSRVSRRLLSETISGSRTNTSWLSPAPPHAFRRKLLSIKCGNSDNGYGAGLHDDALVKLAQACPGLQNAVLELCTAISDQGLASLLKSCPGMRTVSITGHDRGRGRITSKGLDALNKDKTLGAKLLKLHLVDQHLDASAVKRLTKKRPALEVVEGDTDGDGIASQMLASMGMGRSITAWKGGKADDEFDSDDDPFSGPRFGAYYGPPRGRGRGWGGNPRGRDGQRGRGGQRGQLRGSRF
ncbi:hypothetical protein PG987_004907 [Apiospora arundinis]